jgi:uncharacterized protein
VAPPAGLIPGGPINTNEQRGALARLAASVRAGDGRYRALEDIVARARPRLAGAFSGPIQTTDIGEQCARAAALDASYLFVQGPPGTGKTWTGARIVVDLIRRGRRVGVAATSHKAIHNLLDEVDRTARKEGVAFRGLKKCTAGNPETEYASDGIRSAAEVRDFVTARRDVLLFAGTAWLFAHHDLDGAIDTLVIDEAGQVSLADALAMGTAARNVILLGDPLQLAQVSQGTHPEGTGASVLEHLLGSHPTVPADMGIFLDRTRRMHPDVCAFISEIVYESRLEGIPEVADQTTAFGTGCATCRSSTPATWRPRRRKPSAWRARSARCSAARGPIVTSARRPSSRATSWWWRPTTRRCAGCARRWRPRVSGTSPWDGGQVPGPRGGRGLLLDGHVQRRRRAPHARLPVLAQSPERGRLRAMCLACVVASPRLLESRARTIEQMRLINALCRFVEMAKA